MNYLSLFSGIEAATVAWKPLGWKASAFAEIDPFPSAVLKYHYPDVPNLGDVSKYKDWKFDEPIDLIVGGFPCQSFSIAGLRKGLDDPRGNLMLTFGAVVAKVRPRWLVGENVPGLLSSDGGRDFASLLGLLTGQSVSPPEDGWKNSGILSGYKNAYGVAWRVLDAQHFGVPQRRRRVFVVGYFGDWRPAAAVLFERYSLSGNNPPSRKTREEVADAIRSGVAGSIGAHGTGGWPGGSDDVAGAYIPELSPIGTLSGQIGKGGPSGQEVEHLIARSLRAQPHSSHRDDSDNFVAHTLRCEGFDASEDGTGRGTPIIAFSSKDSGQDSSDISPTLRSMNHSDSHANGGGQVAVVYPLDLRNGNRDPVDEQAYTLDGANGQAVASFSAGQTQGAGSIAYREEQSPTLRGGASGTNQVPALLRKSQVRRLTPRECGRLQGFPDDHCAVPFRGKPAADGPQYKAYGNSFAVPVVAWIGEGIQNVEDIINGL